MTKTSHPVVSIVCVTYNHEKYIGQALDSFLAQKTTFPVEILVHDDASTDGTKQILQEYAKKHPSIILFLESKNQYSQGNDGFINELYAKVSGRYLALCEGDDFWTDPEKLQRQVDFLEKHPDYSLCFHSVRIFYEDKAHADEIYPASHKSSDFTLARLLKFNFIQSNSVMYRVQPGMLLPSGVIPLDWYTHLYHAQYGKIGFIDREMAAYRRHAGGIWWGATHKSLDEIWRKYGLQHLKLFVELEKIYGSNPLYAATLRDHMDEVLRGIVKADQKHNQDQLYQAICNFPGATRTYMRDEILRQEQALKDLKKHANEQAKIIDYYVQEYGLLKRENDVLKRHPIKTAVKSKLNR